MSISPLPSGWLTVPCPIWPLACLFSPQGFLWIPFLLPRTPPSLGMAASYYLIFQVSCGPTLPPQEDFSDHHASELSRSQTFCQAPTASGSTSSKPYHAELETPVTLYLLPIPHTPSHHYHHPLTVGGHLIISTSLHPAQQGSAVLLDQRMNESNPYLSPRRVCLLFAWNSGSQLCVFCPFA